MVTAKNLVKHFESGDSVVKAVDEVSFTLPKGTLVALMGRSGSGKSTLLSLLGALDRPQAGQVEIEGKNIGTISDHDLTEYRRKKVGFIFQAYNLIPNLTALQNVMLPMELAGVATDKRRKRAAALLAEVGLDPLKQSRRPSRLSGGEQQRVAIARALANNPSLILADEPTGNLDVQTGQMIITLLRDLARAKQTTIIAATHDPAVAARADLTLQMKDGKLTT
jgi:putative ABC transport system ATP-binding protein